MNTFDSFKGSPFYSSKHSTYFDVYDELFNKFLGVAITFVEIGVSNGGSLLMWREFFGSKVRIIGVDLNPEVVVWQDYDFEIYIGSQSDSKFWENLLNEVGSIDILLDDGGHTFLQQITTVDFMINAIVPDGLVVVEDTHTSYIKEFAPISGSTFIDYAFSIVHGINYRFGMSGSSYEIKVYSVQFFESIVVIRINSRKCVTSSPVINNENIIGYDARDYRYGYSNAFQISKYRKLFLKLKKNPFSYNVLKKLYLFISLVPKSLKISTELKLIKSKF